MHFVAIRMLLGDRAKYFGMILGLTFASLIMTQQPGIFVGIMARAQGFISDVGLADIWVMNPATRFVDDAKAMPDTALLRVRGVEGVEWAVPLFKSVQSAKLSNGIFRTTDVVGLDDATLIGRPPQMLEGRIEDMRRSDAIIVDENGAKDRLAWTDSAGILHPLRVGDTLELNDRRAVVVGIALASRGFIGQPIIYTTYSRARLYSPPQRRSLSYVLATARPGIPVEVVAARITATTGQLALTTRQFKERTIRYWIENTGIPINFGIAVTLGFLVGAAIAGQTFYNFTRENLRQFGTLKAMGTKNSVLLHMIVLQGLTVGAIGYGLGVGLGALFGMRVEGSVLAFYLPWQLLVFSAVGVTLIIMVSALFSILTVFRLEAAIVFRS